MGSCHAATILLPDRAIVKGRVSGCQGDTEGLLEHPREMRLVGEADGERHVGQRAVPAAGCRPLPEVPQAAVVRGDAVTTIQPRHDTVGLHLGARTACPGWLAERLNVAWAIDVLVTGPPPIPE